MLGVISDNKVIGFIKLLFASCLMSIKCREKYDENAIFEYILL